MALLNTFLLAALVGTSVYTVPSSSMEPTLQIGDTVWTQAYSPRRQPRRGDIALFEEPPGSGRMYMKRLVGLPNEAIEFSPAGVKINGQALVEPYLKPETTLSEPLPPNPLKVQIPDKAYFVLGDNRHNSRDSRIFGCVSLRQIKGRVVQIMFPFERIKVFD